MLDGTFGRSVGKSCNAFPLQGHALYLNIRPLPRCALHIEIKSGTAKSLFRPDQTDILVEASRLQPLSRHLIRRIGIHIYQAAFFLHRHKVICGRTGFLTVLLQIYLCPLRQKFPASARILHMHLRPRAHQIHIGDKTVRPLYKFSGDNLCILHILLFL